MRSRVRFPVLPWELEDSRGDHGLGRLVEFRFKGPPSTKLKLNSVALVRERPPPVGEVSANFCG